MPEEDPNPEADGRAEEFDWLAYRQASVSEPKSIRGLVGLTGRSVRIAQAANRGVFWTNVLLSFLSAILLGAQVLLGKLALQALLENQHGGSVRAIILPILGLASVTALGGLANNSQSQLQRLLGEQVQRETWAGIISVTTRVRLETFESPEFFDALQRVKTNALLRPITLVQGLVQFTSGALSAAGLVAALLVIQPILVPVLLIGAVPLWMISRRTGRMEFRFRVGQTAQLRLNEYLTDTLSGRVEAKEIRAFDLGAVLERRWAANYRAYIDDYRAHIRRRLLWGTANAVVTTVTTAASLGLLVWLIIKGHLALASGGAALIAIRSLGGTLAQMFTGVSDLFESAMFLRDYEEFLARETNVHVGPSLQGAVRRDGLIRLRLIGRGAPDRPFQEIELRSVSFRYPGSAAWALRDVCLTLRAGESIALVGENGSGKTTLAKLISQLYVPTIGSILWDGADVMDLDPRVLRMQIGVIFQDFVRYQLTARENIGFGGAEKEWDPESIVSAARQAGADGFLSKLPRGYETGLGKEYQGGLDLSLGQWQRVALARAFFRDAALLVLDEPTASLDARSEHQLFQHVRRLAAGRALVLISHRFSTVREADRIYVMHEGEMLEDGSHDELMHLGGRYAELFELQASAYR